MKGLNQMKTSLLLLGLLGLFGAKTNAQTFPKIDVTPMDMAYYPDRYAEYRKFAPEKIGTDKAMIRVTYSRPAKKGRPTFGAMIPFNQVWRAGANEAPEVKFYRDVTMGGKKIAAGHYALLLIPSKTEWTIILSTDVDQWGAYSYNPALDVARVRVPVQKSSAVIEHFSIQFLKKTQKTITLFMGWDTTIVDVPILF